MMLWEESRARKANTSLFHCSVLQLIESKREKESESERDETYSEGVRWVEYTKLDALSVSLSFFLASLLVAKVSSSVRFWVLSLILIPVTSPHTICFLCSLSADGLRVHVLNWALTSRLLTSSPVCNFIRREAGDTSFSLPSNLSIFSLALLEYALFWVSHSKLKCSPYSVGLVFVFFATEMHGKREEKKN